MVFWKLIMGIVAVAWLGSAGQVAGQAAEQNAEENIGQSTSESDSSTAEENPVTESTRPVFFESYAGDFNITFPSGCAKTRERIPVDDSPDVQKSTLPMAVHVFCDRQGHTGEGCSVSAYVDHDLNADPSGDPSFVMNRVQAILNKYGVGIFQQKPYHEVIENGPRLEGVDVLATDSENKGQVWVRGLLVEGDVYILAAWRSQGQLALDPEYVAFFDSFRPHGCD